MPHGHHHRHGGGSGFGETRLQHSTPHCSARQPEGFMFKHFHCVAIEAVLNVCLDLCGSQGLQPFCTLSVENISTWVMAIISLPLLCRAYGASYALA